MNLAKMLAMKVIKIGGGSITVYDRPMVLVPAEVLVRFHETLEDKGRARMRRTGSCSKSAKA